MVSALSVVVATLALAAATTSASLSAEHVACGRYFRLRNSGDTAITVTIQRYSSPFTWSINGAQVARGTVWPIDTELAESGEDEFTLAAHADVLYQEDAPRDYPILLDTTNGVLVELATVSTAAFSSDCHPALYAASLPAAQLARVDVRQVCFGVFRVALPDDFAMSMATVQAKMLRTDLVAHNNQKEWGVPTEVAQEFTLLAGESRLLVVDAWTSKSERKAKESCERHRSAAECEAEYGANYASRSPQLQVSLLIDAASRQFVEAAKLNVNPAHECYSLSQPDPRTRIDAALRWTTGEQLWLNTFDDEEIPHE